MQEFAVAGSQLMLSLIIGIIVLVFLMLKTKIHPFLAMLISALVIGFIAGIKSHLIISYITAGFGTTIGSIGIIIGFGVMMGQIFEVSGAAGTMAKSFIKLLGRGRERIALAITGFIVSIPIFCDSGFIILFPIVKSISRKTKISIVSLGTALAAGLVITHSLVPPTPGPVGVAGIYGVSVGSLILLGLIVSIPMLIACILYAKHLNTKIYQLPEGNDGWVRPKENLAVEPNNASIDSLFDPNEKLPSVIRSFSPLIVPIILILCGTIIEVIIPKTALGTGNFSSTVLLIRSILVFLGNPVVAVGSGMLLAIYLLTGNLNREETISTMDQGVKSAGIIILLTGAGGALGKVIAESGAGKYMAHILVDSPIPVIIIPFIVASAIRVIQGSGTVAMLTSATITAPILLPIESINPLFAAMSACIGSLLFSHFNDSYFWVVNRSMGITNAKEQIKIWSITTTIAWATGFVFLMILNAFFG